MQDKVVQTKQFTNVYQYVEDVEGKARYFYFIGMSPWAIPNLPNPARATLFISAIEIMVADGPENKFDANYPWGCRVKKDANIPEIIHKAASIATSQKYYASPLPSNLEILTPLYPFWHDIFRGPVKNISTPRGMLRQKDLQTVYFEHTYMPRQLGFH